jgi:hypothetical protein
LTAKGRTFSGGAFI